MKKVKLFECEFCGKRFSTELGADICEKSHEKIKKIKKTKYKNGEIYPETIDVDFGLETVRYKLDKILEIDDDLLERTDID